ncbi:Tripeptidyl-peptidase sed1 [Lachnellula cervina]|uniref:Tripeptidyl-peptidase sed1 n=1 Tax=Lachnellula cervina TaxID=1316786 RepID=A0A7D8YU43_9HELO|nr:Tripeptidyl-peptidase sed1 [Lachnellula cervina]
MYFLKSTILALAVGTSFASPTPRHGHVRHEKRTGGDQLIKRSRADPSWQLPVRIALAQNNLDHGGDRLLDISDPQSANFGKHMSSKEVGDLFRPSSESIGAVRHWLHDSGIELERHNVTVGRGWLKFYASVEELEDLLSAQYHVYGHSKSEEAHIGCDEYHLPSEIAPHVDFVTPSVSMIRVAGEKDLKKKKRSEVKSFSPASFPPHTAPAGGVNSDSFAKGASEVPCHTAVTPDCLRTLYGIPLGNSSATGNEIGIFESGDFYDQADLDLTFESLAPYVPNGTHPTLHGIDGGKAPMEDYIGIESLLDMSLIFPLIHPQQAILFQVDDLHEVESAQGFGDTFLDALDASYCTFEGGDDPTLDPKYPDTNTTGFPAGTWNQAEQCGAYTPTNVISVSYGLGEDKFSRFYWNRQCQEYMKLGLQGVSVIYSSGDSGVSNRGQCITPNITHNYDNTGAFSPSFPASCPWLTSVGATQFNDDDKTETAVNVPTEEYYSGGGFSNYWPAPSYQESTLAKYFTNTPPPYNNNTVYGTPYYNKSGRGYPDVAAIGQNILLYSDNTPTFVGGTSASAPIFASIITLINEQRLAAGKSVVGFINPTLYKNPDAFTDITTGSNPGCGTEGFPAVEGWDPVTGLGTPIFDKLLAVFLALP